jgi:purine-cytosine permease-like protein
MTDHRSHHRTEPQLSEPLGPSLIFIYFMIGFVLGGALTMVLLSFMRPLLPLEASWVKLLVLAPLVIGGILGARIARIGSRERLPLSASIRRAFGGSR